MVGTLQDKYVHHWDMGGPGISPKIQGGKVATDSVSTVITPED